MTDDSSTVSPEIIAIMERLALLERRLAEAELKIYRQYSTKPPISESEPTAGGSPKT
jgi:hypothetical protein